ncbi:MAG: threonine/serine exporter family protein [Aeromicrobium sp.]|uniref:threonine/serine ThrE exporter family protein n=1 Tax=Aeromicrobium sp. TaxID=1871063 RepID=UPI00260E664B|nr:threonine/serine exporter family protein [Aeromicrobium sp.]MDF1706311.1 threonine/serine exporter family protein [Aeromicrobium sp.]
MSEVHDRQRTLDLALRIGELLLSNGAGAADVTATMSSVAHHLGLRQTLVDVTFTTLTLTHQPSVDDPVVSLTRHVTHRETDFADLTSVDYLVTRLLSDEITRDEAASEVARIASSGHPRKRWAITAGSGLTGAGVALLLGGDWIVLLIAAVAGSSIEVLQRRMARMRLPFFYAQVAGGVLATTFAVVLRALEVPVDPSIVVTASIIMLLAGQGFIGAIQDALTGFYITANARILEVMIATAGIIVGVSAGLAIGRALGVNVRIEPGAYGLSDLPAVTIGAAITAGSFAFTAYSPKRVVAPIAALAALAAGAYFVPLQHGVGRAACAGIGAIVIGLISYWVAGWFKVPPLVVITACIVPLLPGLSIYRALSLLADDDVTGVIALITAAAVALALSAGAILGEYVAQPLRRESRKLEQRLAGPRLVGPLRARARRK